MIPTVGFNVKKIIQNVSETASKENGRHSQWVKQTVMIDGRQIIADGYRRRGYQAIVYPDNAQAAPKGSHTVICHYRPIGSRLKQSRQAEVKFAITDMIMIAPAQFQG